MQSFNIKERPFTITGNIRIDTYRAGMVEVVSPLLEERKPLFMLPSTRENVYRLEALDASIQNIMEEHFIRTAVECKNLVMDSPGYGIDLIIQRLVGINTYSLNILYGEIGTGTTTPALGDTGLTTPTNRAAVGFQQNYGSTDAIFQFFFSDAVLANQTYTEFGTFVDGTSTIGSGQIFNHALFSSVYTKVAGQDSTCNIDFEISNSS